MNSKTLTVISVVVGLAGIGAGGYYLYKQRGGFQLNSGASNQGEVVNVMSSAVPVPLVRALPSGVTPQIKPTAQVAPQPRDVLADAMSYAKQAGDIWKDVSGIWDQGGNFFVNTFGA